MAATKKRKTRRKKHHYKTGVHKSPKCLAPFKYRSGWELAVAIYLDENPDVIEYSYEPVTIDYISNSRSGKLRKYHPDFLVIYSDGHKVLVEVKRQDKLKNALVMKKAEAAKTWVKLQENMKYEMWTDSLILPLLKAQKTKKKS